MAYDYKYIHVLLHQLCVCTSQFECYTLLHLSLLALARSQGQKRPGGLLSCVG